MLSELEYEIISEVSAGPEEFFVLVSSVYPGPRNELETFLRALVGLFGRGLLACRRGSQFVEADLIRDQLKRYVEARLGAGEALDEHPDSLEEFSFEATDFGIQQLRPEDRPVPTRV
jgi:hypothetical protein